MEFFLLFFPVWKALHVYVELMGCLSINFCVLLVILSISFVFNYSWWGRPIGAKATKDGVEAEKLHPELDGVEAYFVTMKS